MKCNLSGTGILFLAMLLVGMALIPAVNAKEVSSNNGVITEENLAFTTTELNDFYKKYNISENDLKFARSELPNYLEGTILDSNLRVIASETGKPPEGLIKGKDYDLVISHEEMFAIIDGAKEKYIKKYGVDPANPKIDIVNGYALPEEEANKLVADGKMKLETDAPADKVENNMTNIAKNVQSSILSVGYNPYAINGIINEYIFVATDSRHRPTQAITQDTHNALYRFENFGIGVNTYWYWNYWSASDVSPESSTYDALDDLEGDTNWVRDSANDLIIGWMHNMDHNGRAQQTGPYSVCADTADGLDWPHDSIVQHEVSHNFDVPEVDSPLHPTCIMKYSSAYSGTDIWCTSCGNTVDYGIDH